MRASIRDVAQRAGVSPMTVSNVLRRRTDRTSEETRTRVLDALRELNYIPVAAAAQNRHIATHVLGVIFLQNMQGFVGERTFHGMTERAREQDRDLLISLRAQPSWMTPDAVTHLLDRRCDGYIVVGSYRPEISSLLVAHGVPVVECFSRTPPPGVAHVVGDDAGAMELAVAHLVDLGHQRIAHLGGPLTDGEAVCRSEAFGESMRRHGRTEWANCIVHSSTWGPGDREAGYSLRARPFVEQVLSMEPTAVVCANDLLALDLWRAAEERGLRVPADLSITGMDDSPEAGARALTTLSVSFEDIGRAAVDLLLQLVAGSSTEIVKQQMPAQLKIGITTGSIE